jgi:predicted aspartyl protease
MIKKALAAIVVLSQASCAAAPAPSITVEGDRLFVDARVNSVATVALLDSAAEISVIDKTWAEAIGLKIAGAGTAKGTGGEVEASFAEGVSIESLGVKLDELAIAVLDLSDISTRLIGRNVSFILGREIFDAERLAIDIEARSIARVDRAAQPDGVKLALNTHRGIETFDIRANGVPARAEFDLGNGGAVLIGADFARKLGLLDNAGQPPSRTGGGVSGAVERKIVRLANLEIAGEDFSEVEAEVDETENAGELNIGVNLLRKFRITTDFADRAVWLEPR